MGKYDQLNLKFHEGLFEEICSYPILLKAFKDVKKNKGAPGVDNITIEEFERNLRGNLHQIKYQLENWKYFPKPVKRVEIPKPGGQGVRNLGIPTIKDRVVQAAIKIVIEPILEPRFSAGSYGFRPNKNQSQAVKQAQEHVQSGKEYVVDIDLAKFFDRINHDRLIWRLSLFIEDKRVLRLIGITLRSGIMNNGLVSPSKEGAVQGGPLSPLLSNVVLDELDKELERRSLSYCRFADDCNIFVSSQKAAERVMGSICKFIERKLKLQINRLKSKAARSEFVKFLGMTIIAGSIAISQVSMSRAMDRVRELTTRGTSLTLSKSLDQINKWYVGWANYFKMTQYPSQLSKIEAHIRRRLRARIIKQQKSKRSICRMLVKRGVSKRYAQKTVYKPRKTWVLSHTRAVEKALSNRWFEKQGMVIKSKENLKHWFQIRQWVRFRS